MIKWAPVASLALLLLVLWTQDVMPVQTGDRLNEDQTNEGAIMELRLAMMAEERSVGNKSGYIDICLDRGCLDRNGRCGLYWFSKCKLKTSTLCSGVCTCCVR